jgi:hypothetical protein
MLVRALSCAIGMLSVSVGPTGMRQDPCPEGRTLETQLESADAVVFGKVTEGGDCPPVRVDTLSRLELPGCIGQRVQVRIQRSWKGPANKGQDLLIDLPKATDSTGLRMRQGEQHVVFAKLLELAEAPTWVAKTDACMLPEGSGSSAKALVKDLDRWFRSRQ